MQSLLLEYYLSIKALHVISIIAWMAGLLYLPRLFVYHAEPDNEEHMNEKFKIMERRLLRFIMNPAMIAAWIFGGLMLYANPALFEAGWMHVKLTAIILLTILHHVFAKWRKTFMHDENKKSARFYRYWNEAPTILMIIIVIMAVAEPF